VPGYRRDAGAIRRACQPPATSPSPTPLPPAVPRTPPPNTGTEAVLHSANDHQPRHDTVRYCSTVWNEAKVVGDGADADRYKDAAESSEYSTQRQAGHHCDLETVDWRPDMRSRSSPCTVDLVATATVEYITPTTFSDTPYEGSPQRGDGH